jgi:hypothetical protein
MLTFQGKVDDKGQLRIINRKLFDDAMMNLCGKDITIEIEKKISKRSHPQNAYYWSGVVPVIREALINLGHILTKEEVHQFLKMRFLKTEICNSDGEIIGERTKSSTELTKSQFGDYIAQIQQFAAEILGVYVPDPNEQTQIEI